jgi:hypothetical protein
MLLFQIIIKKKQNTKISINWFVCSKSFFLHFDKVIILEKSVDNISSRASVLSGAIHLIIQPFSFIVTAVSPSVDSLTLSVAVFEVSFVNVTIGKMILS